MNSRLCSCVVEAGRGGVGGAVAGRPRRGVVVGDRDRGSGVRADGGDRQPMAEQLVVGDRERVEEQGVTGCVRAEGVPHGHVDEGFVQRDPHLDPVAERLRDQAGVVGEAVGGVPVQPAAGILEGLRQIPVEQGGHGIDPPVQQGVDEPVVERQAGRVDRAAAGGLDPGPGDREAVRVDTEVGEQVDILGVPVVMVARHCTAAAVGDPAGFGGEGVPDRRSAPVLVDRTLDLIGGGRGTPGEPGRESHALLLGTRKFLG